MEGNTHAGVKDTLWGVHTEITYLDLHTAEYTHGRVYTRYGGECLQLQSQ